MPATLPPPVRKPSIVLSPPSGTRAATEHVIDEDARQRGRNRWRTALRDDPTRVHLMAAAVLYWIVPWALARLQGIPLPHDGLFSAVVYLMWSGSPEASRSMTPLFGIATSLNLLAATILVAAALLPEERMFGAVHAVARRFYRYAIALPLWTILAANLARFVANAVYALSGTVSWNLTPTIARLETPFIEWLQHGTASLGLSAFASDFYSAIWLAPIAFAGFLLVAMDRPKAMNTLLVAYVLTSVLAIPFFVLLPVFDPWTTNALYGASGLTTGIRYLYTNPSVSTLTQVNTQFHWAAGSALPSLHVAFPLVVSLVLRRHGLRLLSLLMAAMTVMTMFVIVYLGRHWVLDAVAAIPFAFAVVALGRRIPFDVILGPRGPKPSPLRPGEVAVRQDPNEDAVQWLSAVFFVSGFAALLYQVVWQRTLFGIIGLNIESVTLVVTAFMLGLGTGSLVGGAVSRRATSQLPLLFAAAEVGIGLFGFFSMGVFRFVGEATLTMSATATAVTTFATLLPPTILMGATLPLLVMNQVRLQRNVGDAVGRLYFTNTLGSAVAAAVAALLFLGHLGQQATVQVAAVLNIGVGILVYARARRAGGAR